MEKIFMRPQFSIPTSATPVMNTCPQFTSGRPVGHVMYREKYEGDDLCVKICLKKRMKDGSINGVAIRKSYFIIYSLCYCMKEMTGYKPYSIITGYEDKICILGEYFQIIMVIPLKYFTYNLFL